MEPWGFGILNFVYNMGVLRRTPLAGLAFGTYDFLTIEVNPLGVFLKPRDRTC
jgi:hypothetical protein